MSLHTASVFCYNYYFMMKGHPVVFLVQHFEMPVACCMPHATSAKEGIGSARKEKSIVTCIDKVMHWIGRSIFTGVKVEYGANANQKYSLFLNLE